jgi:hypothetical protein
MRSKVVLSVLLVVFCASPAPAEQDGGGALGLVFDDRVILADPFIERTGNRTELHPLLVQELTRARFVMRGFGLTESFFEDQVFNPLVEFQMTDQLPQGCRERVKLNKVPPRAVTALVACTRGSRTWLKGSSFTKMSVREQAKTIVHERLHASVPDAPEEYRADFTDGLELALSLYNAQLRGERPILHDDEYHRLKTLLLRTVQMGLFPSYNPDGSRLKYDGRDFVEAFDVFRDGGGVVATASVENGSISRGSYIGVGIVVHPNSNIEEGAELIASNICVYAACNLASNSRVIESESLADRKTGQPYNTWTLGAAAQVVRSRVEGGMILAERARLENSQLRGTRIYIHADSSIRDSTIFASACDNCGIYEEHAEIILEPQIVVDHVLWKVIAESPVDSNGLRFKMKPRSHFRNANITIRKNDYVGYQRAWSNFEIPSNTDLDFQNTGCSGEKELVLTLGGHSIFGSPTVKVRSKQDLCRKLDR